VPFLAVLLLDIVVFIYEEILIKSVMLFIEMKLSRLMRKVISGIWLLGVVFRLDTAETTFFLLVYDQLFLFVNTVEFGPTNDTSKHCFCVS
jgi:predicted metal-dependent enzyme (double-stranded beta helix superfamily)